MTIYKLYVGLKFTFRLFTNVAENQLWMIKKLFYIDVVSILSFCMGTKCVSSNNDTILYLCVIITFHLLYISALQSLADEQATY